MARPKKIITKAECAELLGLSRPRISQLVAAGLPTVAGGRIEASVARAWYKANVVPHLGAKKSKPASRGSTSAPVPAASPVSAVPPEWRDAYRAGAEHGAILAGFRICGELVSAFGQFCGGPDFAFALDQDKTLAYRAWPAGAAVALAAGCCGQELAWCCESGLSPVPEPNFLVFGDAAEVERARRIFAQAAEVCKKHPWPDWQTEPTESRPGAFEAGRRRGAAVVARRLCAGLASSFVEMSAMGAALPGEWDVPSLWHKVWALSLLSTLVQGWCADLLIRAEQMGMRLPELDFGLFGAQAAEARESFMEFTAALNE